MVTEKTLRFQAKNWNLDDLANQITQQLQVDGYKTQIKSAPVGTIIQAQKAFYATLSLRTEPSP